MAWNISHTWPRLKFIWTCCDYIYIIFVWVSFIFKYISETSHLVSFVSFLTIEIAVSFYSLHYILLAHHVNISKTVDGSNIPRRFKLVIEFVDWICIWAPLYITTYSVRFAFHLCVSFVAINMMNQIQLDDDNVHNSVPSSDVYCVVGYVPLCVPRFIWFRLFSILILCCFLYI